MAIIRKATRLDIDIIERLEKLCFEEARSRSQVSDAVLSNDKNKSILIAECNDNVIGYVWREYSEIIAIAIDKNYRNKGIAIELLKQIIRIDDEIYLEVREDNTAAINLYYKIGFESIAFRKKYYPDGANAVVMRYKS